MASHWIETINLCRHYQRGTHTVKAVDCASFAMSRGEFVAICGSSGSGKSTMLNLLAGLDTPTDGEIRIEQKSLSSLNSQELSSYRAKMVGMIFQSFNLIGHRTALENVELALYFKDISRSSRRIKSKEMLEQLGLGDRIGHNPSDLSGGEQQRVAIARALVKEPQILFADEPTGNLDEENSEQIAALLTKLNKDGLTIVMVTHDIAMAHSCASRVIKMHYGKIVSDDHTNTKEAKS